MLNQPGHHRMVVGKSTFDSQFQRHLKCSDFVHHFSNRSFGQAIGLRFPRVRMFWHSNMRLLDIRLRSLIFNSLDVYAIPPRHGAGILNERNNRRLSIRPIGKMHKSTFHNEPAQSGHYQWIISLATHKARENKFVGVQFQNQYCNITIIFSIFSESIVTD